MWLVKGEKVLRQLTEDEVKHVCQTLTPDTEVFKQQQRYLVYWRERHYWLKCHCRKDISEQPINTLRRLSSGVVCTVHHTESPEHDKSCSFWRAQKKPTDKSVLRADKIKNDFVFHRQIADKQPDDDKEKKPSSRVSKPSMPGLQRFIYTLAHKAKIDRIYPDTQLKESECLKRVRDAAFDLTLAKRFRLSDFLFFRADDKSKAVYRLKATASYWVGSAREHCVFLLPIDAVEKEHGKVDLVRYRYPEKGKSKREVFSLPKDCDVTMPGRFIVNKQNPAIAAVTITNISQTETPFYGAAKAVILPIVSKANMMIIDSNYERVVAKALRACQRQIANQAKAGLRVCVRKPLLDLRAPISNLPCRPDFVLEAGPYKVILEVMGTHDEDYIERKSRTVPLMEELAPVIEFDAFQADKDNELEGRSTRAAQEAIEILAEKMGVSTPW